MCGIAGGISFNGVFFPASHELRKGADFLKFRGPDDEGILSFEHSNAKVALAHTRLSIIDLSPSGHQPMVSNSGQTVIVFNGEIYNHIYVRRELEKNQFKFRSTSDTEVILNAIECWGIEEALRRIDGMFAFAVFDRKQEALFLARDRFGKKPLYFFEAGDRLAFSSDIRAFHAMSDVPKNLDMHALGYYLSELATPEEASIWRDIRKLKPASYLRFDAGGISVYKRYWQLSYTEDCKLNYNDIVDNVDQLLRNAVKKRLVSDVPVSAMLSGGIDSSLVVAKMAQIADSPVKTYSVGFDEQAYNELPYARYVASKFGTEHTEIVLKADTFSDLSGLIWEFGEPFADSSMIPTYLVSREIAKNEKVVLGGDGGDEIFAGYTSYHFARKYDHVKALGVLSPLARLASRIYPSYRTQLFRRLLDQTRLPSFHLLDRNIGFNKVELKELLSDREAFDAVDAEHERIWREYGANSKSDLINTLSCSLRTRLLNDYLVKVDRASMFASLETRSPFLDKDLAEFTATVPAGQFFSKWGTKSILKQLALKYYSKEFVHRNKMGFSIPLGSWLQHQLKDSVKDTILGGRQSLVALDYKYIELLLRQHLEGQFDHTHKIWSLYVFHVWSRNV